MEKLTSPNGSYLLEPGVEVLHHQTKDWQSNIVFWQDKLLFLTKVLDQTSSKVTSGPGIERVKSFREQLQKYKNEVLPELSLETREHEKSLALLLKQGEGYDHTIYRDRHEILERRLEHSESELYSLKRDMFSYFRMIIKA